jgi:hypothetical protein
VREYCAFKQAGQVSVDIRLGRICLLSLCLFVSPAADPRPTFMAHILLCPIESASSSSSSSTGMLNTSCPSSVTVGLMSSDDIGAMGRTR